MGFFDDFNEIVSLIKEPLQDIAETVQIVKDDAVASLTQVNNDVAEFKAQGTGAVGELKGTIDDITNTVSRK